MLCVDNAGGGHGQMSEEVEAIGNRIGGLMSEYPLV